MNLPVRTLGVLLFVVCSSSVSAQWLHFRDPKLPRTKDGQPALNAPAPRQANGKPDLTGIWYPIGPPGPAQALGETTTNTLTPADGGPIPFQPAAQAEFDERMRTGEIPPYSRCLPHTVVGAMLAPEPFKFVHTDGLTIILFEEFNQFRQVFTDRRPFPDDMQPTWFGYSVGRWERDTFVVETRGFNDRGYLDLLPIHHTETMRTTERFKRLNVGTLQLEVTVEDPRTFTRAWTSQTLSFRLLPDTEFIEHICENERDVAHFGGR